jgi:hypothetical protein
MPVIRLVGNGVEYLVESQLTWSEYHISDS